MLRIEELLSLEYTIAAGLFEGLAYPWEALPRIRDFIMALGPTLDRDSFTEISPAVWVHKSAVIAPTASIAGPLIIDEGAEVRHCAFIRGSAVVGKGCVVGNSTELKNCVLFDKVQVPHYNYVGDAVLGYKAHMGAGAVTSNVKADKSLVVVHPLQGAAIETGLKKFGAILGDYAEVGCNAVLNPGAVLGREATVYPLSMVRGCVPAKSIYKAKGDMVAKNIQKPPVCPDESRGFGRFVVRHQGLEPGTP